MADVVLLDAGPLGMISHPRVSQGIATWLARLVPRGIEVLVPEIADYEVRRELLRAGRTKGVERLTELRRTLGFVPITSEAMLRAAEFWAEARRRGRPTASDSSLDGDVILAAQAVARVGAGRLGQPAPHRAIRARRTLAGYYRMRCSSRFAATPSCFARCRSSEADEG
jgi:predicted nucleic acid-binding protein